MEFDEQWKFFNQEKRQKLESALEQFLMDEGRYDCFTSLNYVLAELAGNADKANLKRAHFQKEGLDPKRPDHYSQGMSRFKDAVSEHGGELVEILDRRSAFLRVWFGKQDGNLVFGVFNNSPLLPIEVERYLEKLRVAKKFRTIQEVMEGEQDRSEGGGLGLIITVLMLRKINLDETALALSSDDTGTTAVLTVPPLAEQGTEVLSEAVVEAIDRIPQFPDSVLEILRILEDPAKSFADIAPIVRKDPSLIASLLKAANSSRYNFPRRIDSIAEAVAVLGLPAIQELLVEVTAERLLMQNYQLAPVKKVMAHSNEVAWYCNELSKTVKPAAAASVFVCAMLHDFGEIVVNSLVPGLTEKIAELCLSKGWNSFSAETLTNGYNHSLVGAALAKKWQFPDRIVEVIQFHHIPLEASRSAQETVCLIYLGDFLWLRSRRQVRWEDLAPGVLEAFPAKTPKEWHGILESIVEKRRSL